MNEQYENTDRVYRYAIYINDGEYFGAVTNWRLEEPWNYGATNVTIYELGQEEPVFVKGRQLPRLPHQMKKEDFLQLALEEIDGFDGALLPEEFYRFIVNRDGSCPYTMAEITIWLSEEEEEEKE